MSGWERAGREGRRGWLCLPPPLPPLGGAGGGPVPAVPPVPAAQANWRVAAHPSLPNPTLAPPPPLQIIKALCAQAYKVDAFFARVAQTSGAVEGAPPVFVCTCCCLLPQQASAFPECTATSDIRSAA